MKLLSCLPTLLILFQDVLGSSAPFNREFSEQDGLVAENLGLLVGLPEGEAKADSGDRILPWNRGKLVPHLVRLPSHKRFFPSDQLPDNHALTEDEIKGRMLVISKDTARKWLSCREEMEINGHMFTLKGGVFERGNKKVAFIFDSETKTAHELTPKGQGEELLFKSQVSEDYLYECDGLFYLKHSSFSDFKTRDMEKDSEEETVEQKRDSYKKQEDANQLFFETLFYQNLEVLPKAADLANFPLHCEYLPKNEVRLAGIRGNFGNHSAVNHYTRQCIKLVRMMQLIKHFKDTQLQDHNHDFENEYVQNISDAIEKAKEGLSDEDQERFGHDILAIALKVLTKPDVVQGYYYDALIRRDVGIKMLFVGQDPESEVFYLFNSLFDFKTRTFSEEVWSQLFPYQVGVEGREEVPLTIQLTVGADKILATFELFAFIDRSGVLYIFEKLDRFMAISIYGYNDRDTVRYLPLRRDSEGQPTLVLKSSGGILFYRHRPSHFARTKCIIANA